MPYELDIDNEDPGSSNGLVEAEGQPSKWDEGEPSKWDDDCFSKWNDELSFEL